jgi:molybdopterin molybdotransferase
MGSVEARRVPRVAILSTGPELTEPGKRLSPGKVFDINAYSLGSAILESGGEPIYSGVVEDNFSELQEALRKALTSADMVVTSGGVSVGPKDLMPKALASLGTPGVIFSGIAIKPGKPTTFAFIDGKPVFSLPGHPTSALLVFLLLVRPAIRSMTKREPENDLTLEASAGARMFSAKGRRTFVMVKLRSNESHGILAEPVQRGESGAISLLARADGFVEIPENVQFVDVDDRVFVHLFRSKTFCL